MNITVSHRGYDGVIVHDPEDRVYHGKILGVRDFVLYHGDTPEEAEQLFREDVDAWLLHYQDEGRQPPKPFASFPADVPHDLRVKAALYAYEHELDAEEVVERALTEFLGKAA